MGAIVVVQVPGPLYQTICRRQVPSFDINSPPEAGDHGLTYGETLGFMRGWAILMDANQAGRVSSFQR